MILVAATAGSSARRLIDEAMADVRAGAVGEVPANLRYGRCAGAAELGNAVGYRYPTPRPTESCAAVPAGRIGGEGLLPPHAARRGTHPAHQSARSVQDAASASGVFPTGGHLHLLEIRLQVIQLSPYRAGLPAHRP
jgi:hypothetical protein